MVDTEDRKEWLQAYIFPGNEDSRTDQRQFDDFEYQALECILIKGHDWRDPRPLLPVGGSAPPFWTGLFDAFGLFSGALQKTLHRDSREQL